MRSGADVVLMYLHRDSPPLSPCPSLLSLFVIGVLIYPLINHISGTLIRPAVFSSDATQPYPPAHECALLSPQPELSACTAHTTIPAWAGTSALAETMRFQTQKKRERLRRAGVAFVWARRIVGSFYLLGWRGKGVLTCKCQASMRMVRQSHVAPVIGCRGARHTLARLTGRPWRYKSTSGTYLDRPLMPGGG